MDAALFADDPHAEPTGPVAWSQAAGFCSYIPGLGKGRKDLLLYLSASDLLFLLILRVSLCSRHRKCFNQGLEEHLWTQQGFDSPNAAGLGPAVPKLVMLAQVLQERQPAAAAS